MADDGTVPQGKSLVINLPKPIALIGSPHSTRGRYLIGCMECDYVMSLDHDCWELSCEIKHEYVMETIPFRILPHWAHPRYETR